MLRIPLRQVGTEILRGPTTPTAKKPKKDKPVPPREHLFKENTPANRAVKSKKIEIRGLILRNEANF